MFNRQGMFDDRHTLTNPIDKYGRNAGGEFYFVNSKGDWQGWAGYHHAMKPGIDKNNNYLNYGAGYFGRSISSFINIDDVGTNFYTDMGFIQRIENYDALNDSVIRLGFRSFYNDNSYTIYPKTGKINLHIFRLTNSFTQNPNHSFNERNISFSYSLETKSTSGLEFRLNNNETRLLYHTSFTDKDPLPPGSYHYTRAGVSFRTDSRKKISFQNGITIGKYFSGNYLEYTTSFIYRQQPWLTIEMNAVYNKLEFAAPYGKANLFLLAPRVEVNFSNKLFWTTFLQYNTQRNNININSRLQWRYKPASDLFLVYTDNYFSDPFLKSKNRAFVFKMNYWLNL